MTDLDFLKGCGIAPDSPEAELALKLRNSFAKLISILSPEEITPEMTCKTLMAGWKPKGWFQDGLDPVTYVMGLEENLGIPIAAEYAETMISPELYPEHSVKALILNYLEVLNAQKQGIPVPPRHLTFWTDKRWYHWAAWGLPILGMAAFAASLIMWRFIGDEEFILRFVPIVIAPLGIWLGIRLWKWHRVTLDRLQFERKYRAVLYVSGTTGILLEPYDFANYGGWDFADAATAAKRAGEIAAFLNLPLETPQMALSKVNISLFRGWNPVDWSEIDTGPFFLKLSSFLEKCKTAGFSADVDTLLGAIRGLSSFSSLAEAIVKFEAGLPQDVLPAERKTLLEAMGRTNDQEDAYFKFLQDCEVESGTMGAYQAQELRKLWAVGSCRLSEHEVTADMRLGELAPQWFASDDKTEILLDWMDLLGDECATLLNSLQPHPDWTLKELVQKYVDAYTNQYFPHSKKREQKRNIPEVKP